MSLRRRLALILILATGIVWLAGMAWIHVSTRARVERTLDARLAEAARMVSSLLSDHRIDLKTDLTTLDLKRVHPNLGGYEQNLFCQLWSLKGDLVGQSSAGPDEPLSQGAEGFSDSMIDGERWRVYTAVNAELGVRVMVGDRILMRERLVRGVMTGLAVPALVILPLLAALIWVVVGRGLAPLTGIAAELRQRRTDDLTPILPEPRATELRPVVSALNDLFERVSRDRDRERSFTTYAAHELKTPLAGISAQAQIAQRAPDPQMRDAALTRIIDAVKRTDHVVHQLLDLAAVDAGEGAEGETSDLRELVRSAQSDLDLLAQSRGVTLKVTLPDAPAILPAPRFLVWVALRNPLENAVLAAPQGSRVTLDLTRESAGWRVVILDEGRGLSAEDYRRATERFFRGPDSWGRGSGLGLSITQAAILRIGGSFSLAARRGSVSGGGDTSGGDALGEGQAGTRADLFFPTPLAKA